MAWLTWASLLAVLIVHTEGRGARLASIAHAMCRWIGQRNSLSLIILGVAGGIAAATVGMLIGEAVPYVHDEFSYLLSADTFSHLRLANAAPPLPSFFDTFHVLVQPTYASKYFPGQGLVLAVGELCTGHPIAGVWLSVALATMATAWMLRPLVGATASVAGGWLLLGHWGLLSYWSQSYMGGMVAAGGGALMFGAARRLWDRLDWRQTSAYAIGMAILAVTRPLEGATVALPTGVCLFVRFLRRDGSGARIAMQGDRKH